MKPAALIGIVLIVICVVALAWQDRAEHARLDFGLEVVASLSERLVDAADQQASLRADQPHRADHEHHEDQRRRQHREPGPDGGEP